MNNIGFTTPDGGTLTVNGVPVLLEGNLPIHTHSVTDIAGFDFSGLDSGNSSALDWNEIENKPDKFPPIPHRHSVSEIEGLESVTTGEPCCFVGLARTILPGVSAEPCSVRYLDDKGLPTGEVETDVLFLSGNASAATAFCGTTDIDGE